jgi:hypothetical protein
VTDSDRNARLERMAARLRKGASVLEELADEVDAFLQEAPPPSQEAKAFLEWWCQAWQKQYRTKYVVSGAKEIVQIKRALKSVTFEDLTHRAQRYLCSSDVFSRDARHPLGLFISQVNKFIGGDPRETSLDLEPARAVDCHHEPACTTDLEHTRRKLRDMKGVSA